MDSLYGSDRKLGDLEDSGMSEFLLDQDIFPPSSNMFQELTSSMKDQAKCEQTDRAASPELFNWCPEIKLGGESYGENDWFNSLLEDPVLNDKMITDAVQSPRIASDHSYSLNNDQGLNSPLSTLCKMDDFSKDIDTDIFDSNHGALDLSQKNFTPAAQIVIKQEPSSERDRLVNTTTTNSSNSLTTITNNINSSSTIANSILTATVANITNSNCSNSSSSSCSSNNNILSAINITNLSSANNNNNMISNSFIDCPLPNSTSLSTSNIQPTLLFSTTTAATTSTTTGCPVKTETPILSNISIKSEPTEFMDTSPDHSGYDSMNLPPTPPSSNNSDSEGSLSPSRSAPSSPVRPVSTAKPLPSNSAKHISQPLFTNPIPQSGYLVLSEEEKRTLIAEGYPIPGKLPLTKQEEKNLKKIRRKIKNKISAQESRRKKKEYLETLEKQVEAFTQENVDLKKKVDSLETNNRSLIGELQKLQAQCGKLPRSASSTQTGTVLMVVVLSFAVFLGSWTPTSFNIGYSSPSNHHDIFYFNPRPMHPSPSMGPQLQNVRVADYSSRSMKSRVLLSIRDELEDDGLFGPNVPMKNTAVLNEEFVDSPLKTNKSLMGTMPKVWQLTSFKVPHDSKLPHTNKSWLESPFSIIALHDNNNNNNHHHHFYSKFSLAANQLQPDITASAENLPILAFGNATAEIEKPLMWTVNTNL